METLGGFPNLPALGYAGQSPAPPTRSWKLWAGVPHPLRSASRALASPSRDQLLLEELAHETAAVRRLGLRAGLAWRGLALAHFDEAQFAAGVDE